MNKNIIVKLLALLILFFAFAGTSYAATSARLQQPTSPTNQDTFNITFVALDTDSSQSVTVQCEKKGPGDANFVAFGSPIILSNGGNTDVCQVNSGIVNQSGSTYSFRVTASGSSTVQSNSVSVDFNNQTPGTPVNYNKTKLDDCTYKISFRTANDSGKTVKVALYRSADLNFSVDSGHQVNTLNIGSDTDGSLTDNISPNCTTTYYYAIRAFDVYGNGSGIVGDSSVTTTTINGPTTNPAQGAIAVGGAEVSGGAAGGQPTKEVLGTESAKPTVAPAKTNALLNALTWPLGHKKISLLVLIIILAPIAYYLYRRFGKRVK
jgi:hypothetical protein